MKLRTVNPQARAYRCTDCWERADVFEFGWRAWPFCQKHRMDHDEPPLLVDLTIRELVVRWPLPSGMAEYGGSDPT